MVCACRPIQGDGMWYAAHACVLYEECRWTCWIGSVLCVWSISGTECPLWDLAPLILLSAMDASELWLCFYCMTDGPDLETLPHDSEMNFCTFCLHWAELTFSPLLCPSFIAELSFAFNTFSWHFFSLHWFLNVLAAARPKPWLFLPEKTKPPTQLYQQLLHLPRLKHNVNYERNPL